ncbi:hypothetical protein SDRG_06880 [Saprolegnia diclina VS20]|uniref:Uncharacterized protein n=1 Tax=Saprolegnia diclina (strain VS20) TaxID=1156394 RepID=T0RZ34_SAPDV|nr:hypothetical protein SDRG_06880 [Saprolegnia diclina VS20]EQC35592.1 hypothetical protein SDRG_06880 [Saprolegnia diclina VS20]|eukprot:XP_008610909.1 hypothetical protein SDRG_06880 [Saprolegnia diclina VS20]
MVRPLAEDIASALAELPRSAPDAIVLARRIALALPSAQAADMPAMLACLRQLARKYPHRLFIISALWSPALASLLVQHANAPHANVARLVAVVLTCPSFKGSVDGIKALLFTRSFLQRVGAGLSASDDPLDSTIYAWADLAAQVARRSDIAALERRGAEQAKHPATASRVLGAANGILADLKELAKNPDETCGVLLIVLAYVTRYGQELAESTPAELVALAADVQQFAGKDNTPATRDVALDVLTAIVSRTSTFDPAFLTSIATDRAASDAERRFVAACVLAAPTLQTVDEAQRVLASALPSAFDAAPTSLVVLALALADLAPSSGPSLQNVVAAALGLVLSRDLQLALGLCVAVLGGAGGPFQVWQFVASRHERQFHAEALHVDERSSLSTSWAAITEAAPMASSPTIESLVGSAKEPDAAAPSTPNVRFTPALPGFVDVAAVRAISDTMERLITVSVPRSLEQDMRMCELAAMSSASVPALRKRMVDGFLTPLVKRMPSSVPVNVVQELYDVLHMLRQWDVATCTPTRNDVDDFFGPLQSELCRMIGETRDNANVCFWACKAYLIVAADDSRSLAPVVDALQSDTALALVPLLCNSARAGTALTIVEQAWSSALVPSARALAMLGRSCGTEKQHSSRVCTLLKKVDAAASIEILHAFAAWLPVCAFTKSTLEDAYRNAYITVAHKATFVLALSKTVKISDALCWLDTVTTHVVMSDVCKLACVLAASHRPWLPVVVAFFARHSEDEVVATNVRAHMAALANVYEFKSATAMALNLLWPILWRYAELTEELAYDATLGRRLAAFPAHILGFSSTKDPAFAAIFSPFVAFLAHANVFDRNVVKVPHALQCDDNETGQILAALGRRTKLPITSTAATCRALEHGFSLLEVLPGVAAWLERAVLPRLTAAHCAATATTVSSVLFAARDPGAVAAALNVLRSVFRSGLPVAVDDGDAQWVLLRCCLHHIVAHPELVMPLSTMVGCFSRTVAFIQHKQRLCDGIAALEVDGIVRRQLDWVLEDCQPDARQCLPALAANDGSSTRQPFTSVHLACTAPTALYASMLCADDATVVLHALLGLKVRYASPAAMLHIATCIGHGRVALPMALDGKQWSAIHERRRSVALPPLGGNDREILVASVHQLALDANLTAAIPAMRVCSAYPQGEEWSRVKAECAPGTLPVTWASMYGKPVDDWVKDTAQNVVACSNEPYLAACTDLVACDVGIARQCLAIGLEKVFRANAHDAMFAPTIANVVVDAPVLHGQVLIEALLRVARTAPKLPRLLLARHALRCNMPYSALQCIELAAADDVKDLLLDAYNAIDDAASNANAYWASTPPSKRLRDYDGVVAAISERSSLGLDSPSTSKRLINNCFAAFEAGQHARLASLVAIAKQRILEGVSLISFEPTIATAKAVLHLQVLARIEDASTHRQIHGDGLALIKRWEESHEQLHAEPSALSHLRSVEKRLLTVLGGFDMREATLSDEPKTKLPGQKNESSVVATLRELAESLRRPSRTRDASALGFFMHWLEHRDATGVADCIIRELLISDKSAIVPTVVLVPHAHAVVAQFLLAFEGAERAFKSATAASILTEKFKKATKAFMEQDALHIVLADLLVRMTQDHPFHMPQIIVQRLYCKPPPTATPPELLPDVALSFVLRRMTKIPQHTRDLVNATYCLAVMYERIAKVVVTERVHKFSEFKEFENARPDASETLLKDASETWLKTDCVVASEELIEKDRLITTEALRKKGSPEMMKALNKDHVVTSKAKPKKDGLDASKTKPTNARPVVWTAKIPLREDCLYDARQIPFVENFDATFTTAVDGQSKPKIVTCNGTDGKAYKQVVKLGNVLPDVAVMRLMHFFNTSPLRANKFAGMFRTYIVNAIADIAGVLEFVGGAEALSSRILEDDPTLATMDRWDATVGKSGANTTVRLQVMDSAPVTLGRWFLSTFPDPYAWYQSRLTYTRTLAASSMLCILIGLSDRHCANVMFDTTSGAVVNIDFGIVFDCNFGGGEVSEAVPFRLTRNLVAALGPSGTGGLFAVACAETLEFARQHQDEILQLLKSDPAVAKEAVHCVKRRFKKYVPPQVPITMDTVSKLVAVATDPKKLATMPTSWAPWF